MSQNLIPFNGGRTSIQTTISPQTGIFLSPQYVQAKRLEPQPTEWRAGGRPIYDRLPAASERYKLYFGFEDTSAYTYIPVGSPYAGPGSLTVLSTGGNKFLAIQSGVIVWKYGDTPVNPVIIDLKLVGLRSTRYLIAYQLYYDDAPFEAQYEVSDYSLSGEEMKVSSGTDDVKGWRYKPLYAFTNSENESWRNYDGFFPDYSNPAYLCWQTEFPNYYSSIKFRCPKNVSVSGTASLYYQSCPTTSNNDKYCESPEWIFEDTVSVQTDGEGKFFEFNIDYPSGQYGWKVEWSDPKVSINKVTVSGVLTLKRKPATPLVYCQLVAYPEKAVPTTTVNSEGRKVPLATCKLALVDTNNLYEVERVEDIRETVNTNYKPIADWLTQTWDDNLINLYEQVKNYPTSWMGPSSCLLQEYANLGDYLVKVED